MESDRDILIRLDTKVEEIHREMTQPEGKVPRMEKTVEKHSSQIAYWKGAIAIVGFLILAFGTVLFAHMLGNK